MPEVDTPRFTVAVFQDVAWAARALDAVQRHAFPVESLSILGKKTPELTQPIEKVFGRSGETVDVRGIGEVWTSGPLLESLQGDAGGLRELGIAGTMRRVGFQAHDGRIFETLVGRGGVLVAVRSEPRAADALAVFHAYGGGNAAIGAWTGRV
jgi:hypothetical protein